MYDRLARLEDGRRLRNLHAIGRPDRREHAARSGEIVPVRAAPSGRDGERLCGGRRINLRVDANRHDRQPLRSPSKLLPDPGERPANERTLLPAQGADEGERDHLTVEAWWRDEPP